MQMILLVSITSILIENIVGKIPTRRVIGGTETLIQNYPFMASIVLKISKTNTVFSGGASIIGKNWVVTAAHCVFDFNDGIISSQKAFVRSNTTYWEDDFAFSRDHLIIEFIVHEEYVSEGEDYDIALLQVDEPFDGKFETPIRYATENYKYADDSVVTTLGWGTTETNVDPYTVRELREVSINIMQENHCTQLFKKYNINITVRMLCATAPGRDACVNDSGGPLVQNVGNYTLIGIVSWGVECASQEFPGVYTKLSKFHEWIINGIHHHHTTTPKSHNHTDSYEVTSGEDSSDY